MTRLFAAFLASLALCAWPAWGQGFPSKPVHIVVPFPAGGTADLLARSIADVLAVGWRQRVVVEN
jgi:tripartite-type tricarboxylate transporter receptor subunit TctC